MKNQKGITLVALILTIIVLIILAVVTINAVKGDSIISHANTAATKYTKAQNEENQTIANYLKYFENENTDNIFKGKIFTINYNGANISFKIGDKFSVQTTEGVSGQAYSLVTYIGENTCVIGKSGEMVIYYNVDDKTYSFKFFEQTYIPSVTDDSATPLSYSPSEININEVIVPNLYNGLYKADDGGEFYIQIKCYVTSGNINYQFGLIGFDDEHSIFSSSTITDESEIANYVLNGYASKGITVTGDGQIEYNGETFTLLEAQDL